MPDREDLAWAAGLFEGEGCIYMHPNHTVPTVRVEVTSTDLDVLEHFQQVVGFGTISPHVRAKPHHKLPYKWRGSGHERSQALVAMFWPWLGPRRRGRAAELLRTQHASGHPKARNKQRRHWVMRTSGYGWPEKVDA